MTIMKYIKYLIFCVVSLAVSFVAKADFVADADSAYRRGEYAKAVELYNALADEKGTSPELLCNLGNSYAKGGDYGHAMVSYLRALRLDPSNSLAKDNIKYIQSKVADSNISELRNKKLSVEPESLSFFASVKDEIARDHSSNTWAIWAAATFVLFLGCIALYIFTSNVLARKVGFFGGFAMIGISLITLIFSFMAASYKSNEGAIITPKVKLRMQASVSAKESPVFLTRGTKMTILDKIPSEGTAEWYKVRLNSDFVGWIQASDFQPVEN